MFVCFRLSWSFIMYFLLVSYMTKIEDTNILIYHISISVTWSLIQTNPVVSKSFKKYIFVRVTAIQVHPTVCLQCPPCVLCIGFLSMYGMQTLKTVLEEDQGKEKGFFLFSLLIFATHSSTAGEPSLDYLLLRLLLKLLITSCYALQLPAV